MKKLLSLTLALIMLLALAACGDSSREKEKDKDDEKTTKTSVTTEAPTAVEPSGTPVVPPTQTPTQTPSAGDITYGSLENGVFESDYFGFSLKTPSSWTTKTASEIATLNQTDEATMFSDFASVAGKTQTSYLYHSIDNKTGNNVNAVIENLGMTNNKGMSSADYIESAKTLLDSTYENMGATDVEMEMISLEFGSKEFDCLATSLTQSGIYMEQLVIVVPTNDYMAVITFTVTDADSFGYIDDYFTAQ